MNRRLLPVAMAAGTLAVFAGVAGAFQGAKRAEAPVQTGTIDFSTKIGSFKILSPSSEVKARGRITMSFQGTVLVVGLEGNVTPGSGVKVQYDDAKNKRRVFYGRGNLTVEGKWRAIQFFGRDYKGRWDGMGVMRLYGEFDDKLETGTYQIKGYPKESWGNGGRQVQIPVPVQPSQVKPKIEDIKPTKRPGR